jgi:Putative general bacterial porin
MKFSKTILSATFFMVSGLTMANTYNSELELGYVDNGLSILNATQPLPETTSISLSGRYHFTEVDTTNKPLAEAAFMQRRSFVNAVYTDWDIDLANGESGSIQNIGFGFYIPNTMFYLGAQHLRYDYDHSDSDSNTLFELGIAPIDGLLLTTTHSEDADDYEPNIHAKYVLPLAGETAINLEAGFTDVEDADAIIHLAGDYYFTHFFSVGASMTDYEGGNDYSIRTRYFFNDDISVTGQFTSDGELDEDSFSIGASLRF